MKTARLTSLLPLAFLLTTGCTGAEILAGAPRILWDGFLNVRGGAPHEGSYLLTIPAEGEDLAGEYLFSGGGCLKKGRVVGKRSGQDLLMTVSDGVSIMMIKATVEGGALYGRYEFTGGPCSGDWGSTVAKPST